MAAEKRALREMLLRSFTDGLFGAARVRNERIALHQRPQFADRVENTVNRLGEEDQVRRSRRFFQGDRAVNRASLQSLICASRGTDAQDDPRKASLAQSEAERT